MKPVHVLTIGAQSVLLLMGAAALALWPGSAWAQCPSFGSDRKVVSGSTGIPQFSPVLVVDPNYRPNGFGTVYLVYEEGDPLGGIPADIFFSDSTNGGASWSTPIQLNVNSTGEQREPAISVDQDCSSSDGTIWGVWLDNSSPGLPVGNIVITARASTDHGATWSSEVVVEPMLPPNVAQVAPDVAVRDDRAWVAWMDTRHQTTGNTDVFMACGQLVSGTPTFSSPFELNDAPFGEEWHYGPDLDVPLYQACTGLPCANPRVHVAWHNRQGVGTCQILFKSSNTFCAGPRPTETCVPLTNVTTKWSTSIVSLYSSNDLPPAISGYVYITYNDRDWTTTSDTLTVQRSTDKGATWGSHVRVDGSTGGSDYQKQAQIAMTLPWQNDPDDCDETLVDDPKLYIGWHEQRGSPRRFADYAVACSTDGGATWTSPLIINGVSDSVDSALPGRERMALAADIFTNRVYAAWGDSRSPGSTSIPQIWVDVGVP